MEKIIKKEIPERTAIKAFINGFVSYGIIISFITFLVIALLSFINQKIKVQQDFNYMIINSLLKSIILFFLIIFVCRISTFDVLKKCRIQKNDIDNIIKKMKIFFIICIFFSLMVFTFNLAVKYFHMQNDLSKISINNYNSFKDDNIQIATTLTDIEITKHKENWFKYKFCTGIIEISIISSCVYLMTYQKKMIELYNT